MKLLIVVDIQNDFIDGSLGTKEAEKIVPNVCDKIKNWDGDIICTRDTHTENYLETSEGRNLPVRHCIEGTSGHAINDDVAKAFNGREVTVVDKPTFGSTGLAKLVASFDYDYIELVGLCTDICVVSNALLIKATLPEAEIVVDASCCAGVTPQSHIAALTTMKMCQIKIIGEEQDD